MFSSVASATSVNIRGCFGCLTFKCPRDKTPAALMRRRRSHTAQAGLPRLALRYLRHVAAVVIVILVFTERRGVCAAATHSFNAEQLLVRLTIHDHAHEVVARIGGRCAWGSAAAATTTAATTSERRRRHSDDRPDAADRIERRVTCRPAASTTTAAPASSSAAAAGTRRQRRRRRGIKSAERTESAAATAAATTRRLSWATTELLPLSRGMLARLSTTTTTAAASSTSAAATTTASAAGRLLRIDEHADLCPNNANRGRVIAGLRQGIQHLRRACAKQNAVAPL